MKKKILHIVEAFGGGVFTYLVALANATCEEFDVTIAYSLRPQTPEDFKEHLDKRIRLIEMQQVKREINLVQDIKGGKEIKKIFREVAPDVVHLHSSKAGFLGRMVIDCKHNNVIYTPHGFAFLKQDDSALKRGIYRWIEKAAAVKGGKIICVSKGEYEAALTLTKHAGYINNGIDISLMKDKEITGSEAIDWETPRIGTLGRICYQKNPEVVNRIAAELREESFVWIGDGDMRDSITQENIEITGWKKPDEALELLRRIDIFVLPSLWEGLPISLLEAMYLQKICIVSNVIGNRDVIRHGENGFMANSVEEYVGIICELKAGKWDVDKIVRKAHEDVCEEYNIVSMCRKYSKIYQEG